MPLSHAICCRLCMPEELPPTEAPISADDKAVAIMSMGCHASSGTGPFSLQCESRGNSLVTGECNLTPTLHALCVEMWEWYQHCLAAHSSRYGTDSGMPDTSLMSAA